LSELISQMYFDDFEVGQRYDFGRRTVTDTHFALFSAISGDNHPIHYDDVYAKRTRFGRRVTHGLLLAGMTALGAAPLSSLLHDSMVAFVDFSCQFLKPVFIGDSIAIEAEVSELRPKGGTGLVRFDIAMRNQDEEIVLRGSHSYILRTRTRNE